MNLPRVHTCSQSWTLLPPPSPYHPSGSSQCTRSKYPVSCIKPGLAIRFLYDIIHVSMTFSQITSPPPQQSPSFILKHRADFIPDHAPVHPSLCLGSPHLLLALFLLPECPSAELEAGLTGTGFACQLPAHRPLWLHPAEEPDWNWVGLAPYHWGWWGVSRAGRGWGLGNKQEKDPNEHLMFWPLYL